MVRLYEKGLLEPPMIKVQTKKTCESEPCFTVAEAALRVGKVFASLRKDWKVPKPEASSRVKVDKTEYGHPNPQCRFETFMAGNFCLGEVEIDFDNSDFKIGACTKEHFPEGSRPLCWFSPLAY